MTIVVRNLMKKLNWLDYLALTLVIISGLSLGMVGFFDVNLISFICFDFDGLTCLSRFVYGLVGLATVYLLVQNPLCKCKK